MRSRKRKPAAGAQVAVGMYDRSLDAITEHQWPIQMAELYRTDYSPFSTEGLNGRQQLFLSRGFAKYHHGAPQDWALRLSSDILRPGRHARGFKMHAMEDDVMVLGAAMTDEAVEASPMMARAAPAAARTARNSRTCSVCAST